MYASLYSSATGHLQRLAASLLCTSEQKVTLQFISIPHQFGSADCGLFAIAFATALCLGTRLENVQFDQSKMRSHFISCFENQRMPMFPILWQRQTSKSVCSIQTVATERSKCGEWHNLDCSANIPKSALESSAPWNCNSCICSC